MRSHDHLPWTLGIGAYIVAWLTIVTAVPAGIELWQFLHRIW